MSNSSPLIALATLGLLRILTRHKLYVAQAGKTELITGKALRYPQAVVLEEALSKGDIEVKTPVDSGLVSRLTGTGRLSAADAETLALAKEMGAQPIIDDFEARKAAEALNLKPLTTLHILLSAVAEGVVGLQEAQEAFSKLATDLYLSPDVLLAFDEALERIGRES